MQFTSAKQLVYICRSWYRQSIDQNLAVCLCDLLVKYKLQGLMSTSHTVSTIGMILMRGHPFLNPFCALPVLRSTPPEFVYVGDFSKANSGISACVVYSFSTSVLCNSSSKKS